MSNIKPKCNDLAYAMRYQRQLQWKRAKYEEEKMPEDRNQMIEDRKKKEDKWRQKRQCMSDSKSPNICTFNNINIVNIDLKKITEENHSEKEYWVC